MKQDKTYIAIDLKSFYASVECIERGLDPLTTHLVVADESRTTKTICLAVTPALKSYGVSGRARLFEVVQKVNEVNALRQRMAPGRRLNGSSSNATELREDPSLALDYITAPPRMAHYITYSTQVYNVYLKYVAPEDIHVYSIDEVFLDATAYLQYNNVTARGFAKMIVQDVLATTGITATAGIGTNLYLCKVAMDIVAKHIEPDADGVRIAKLNERSYRHLLWDHRPLTDFWRVGHGYARRLEANGIFTMGDVARCSINRENLLYKLFGVNAELLIDHAWGWEPCTIKDIKEYKPSSNSISSGQVLHCPYTWQKAKLIVREMTDALVLELVDKGLVTDQIVLTIGYDIENLSDPVRARSYQGVVTVDHYSRSVPKHAHGTANLGRYTSSTKLIMEEVLALYDRITDPSLLVRRVTLGANHVLDERVSKRDEAFEQVDLFCDYDTLRKQREQEQFVLERERRRQQVILDIKKKYGKNAILKGTSLEEGATARDRNRQIGGHRE